MASVQTTDRRLRPLEGGGPMGRGGRYAKGAAASPHRGQKFPWNGVPHRGHTVPDGAPPVPDGETGVPQRGQ